MTLNPLHLRTLVTVINTGSFAAAARRLGYTGSAVSQQITALEHAVNMPLFERNAQSIRPTPVAQFLSHRAHEVLAALGILEQDIQGMSVGGIGRLRLGSFPTASARLIPAVLAECAKLHPGVEIHLDEGEPDELIQLLGVGELDVALAYKYDLVPQAWPNGLRSIRLIDENLILLLPAGHTLAEADSVLLEELTTETWITSRERSAGAACLVRVCAGTGFAPRIGYRSNDYDVVREFVRSSLGIALVPALAHVPSAGITAKQVVDLKVCRHVTATYRCAQTNPTVGIIIAILRQAAKELAHDIARGLPSARSSKTDADDDGPERPWRR